METKFAMTIPVLPSRDISRDLAWYREKMGFEPYFEDTMYAGICRDTIHIHLQWHADTDDDPLLGGSVIRIFVKNIRSIFEEYVTRGTVTTDRFVANTPWGTNEFGFYDLNGNAIFIVEDLDLPPDEAK